MKPSLHNPARLACTLLAAALLAPAAGCHPTGQNSEAGMGQSGLPTATVTLGGKPFVLEIAATSGQKETGLMYRDSMPADHGMIFLFASERPLSFWMKHTRIPLDVLYLDQDADIVSIHQMQPFDLSAVTSRAPAKYAIELNQGTAAQLGLKQGDHINLPPQITNTQGSPD